MSENYDLLSIPQQMEWDRLQAAMFDAWGTLRDFRHIPPMEWQCLVGSFGQFEDLLGVVSERMGAMPLDRLAYEDSFDEAEAEDGD